MLKTSVDLLFDQLATAPLTAPPGQVDPVGGHQGHQGPMSF